ncbi:MAG: hypothetical protein K9N40_04675 [Candidatus Cloacimonetes bacterium]|nr:hypothetical protein [Candidatus Cloacimonadota bacterium]
MPDQLNPTITLAELYESQDQLLDALMVYQKLLHRKPSTELEEKILDLKKKIFADDEMQYNPVIEQVFSQEERLKFNILPHSCYKNFKSSLKQPKLDSMDDLEEVESDPVISAEYNKELDKVFREFEQEHKDVLVSQPVDEDLDKESSEIFTEDLAEQPRQTEQQEESTAMPPAEETESEKKPEIREEDDFFNIPFEDLAQTFRKDQQKAETLSEHPQKTADTKQEQLAEADRSTQEKPEKKNTPAKEHTETAEEPWQETEEITESSQQEKEQKITRPAEEKSAVTTSEKEIDQDELQAQATEDKIKQITKNKEPEPIKLEEKIEDEIFISTDLQDEVSEKLTVEKVDDILQTEKTEEKLKDRETVAEKTSPTESEEREFQAAASPQEDSSDLSFEPADKVAEELTTEEAETKKEMKFPQRENMEGLSFEEMMARLDEEQDTETTEKPEEISEEVEKPSPPETKKAKQDIEPAAETEEAPDQSKSVATKLKNNLPFEYTEDDISLKELEAELKAEFQKTRKLKLKEKEEPSVIKDISQTDIEPILSEEDKSDDKTVEQKTEITPEVLEKILASNKSNQIEDEIKPVTYEKSADKDDLLAGFEQVEKEKEEPVIKQQKQADSDQLDDLEFSPDSTAEDTLEDIKEAKPSTSEDIKQDKTSAPDLEDLSFDLSSQEEEEDIQKKPASQKPDLGDLDKPFEEIAVETAAKPEKIDKPEASDLEKDFAEISSEKDSKEDQQKAEPETEKRFSEYVPGANKSDDEFFSNSFDDIIKQSNEIIRHKDLGFKADDVIKKDKKEKNDKEKQ